MNFLIRSAPRRLVALATLLTFWTSASSAGLSELQSQGVRTATPAATAAPPPAVTPVFQSRLQIRHEPLACVTTSAGPVVEAAVNPGPDVAFSRVLWRVANTRPYYYYTVMTGTPPTVEGLIPRPESSAKALEYQIEATDRISLSRRSPEYVAPVVETKLCQAKGVVPKKKRGLGLTIGLTDPNQPPVPPGINKDDIDKVILVTGAVVTLAAALQAAGGAAGGAAAGAGAGAAAGISTGVVVGAGVAAAAGIAVAAGVGKGNGATATPTLTPTPSPTSTPVPNRFLEVEATWGGIGDVDVQLIGPTGPVGVPFPASCDATGVSRTERVVFQGSVPSGPYQVSLKASSCPTGTTPPSISVFFAVQSDTGPKCGSAPPIINVPVGQPPLIACSFSVP